MYIHEKNIDNTGELNWLTLYEETCEEALENDLAALYNTLYKHCFWLNTSLTTQNLQHYRVCVDANLRSNGLTTVSLVKTRKRKLQRVTWETLGNFIFEMKLSKLFSHDWTSSVGDGGPWEKFLNMEQPAR